MKQKLNNSKSVPVFDGHNDALLNLYLAKEPDKVKIFRDGAPVDWHIDLSRAKKGNFVGGLFAIFAPDSSELAAEHTDEDPFQYEPLAPLLPLEDAQKSTLAMVSILLQLERAGLLVVCKSVNDIRTAIRQEKLAAVLHLEGAEAIDPDFIMLEVLYAAGLRSIGPVWSRPNIFGHGVPFHFHSTPDIGIGLTDAGKALIAACNELRIMIDLSHMNEKGFRDVAVLSEAPLVATHSNVHELCPHARNLTAWQLSAIRETNGLVGLSFPIDFLASDGPAATDVSIETIIRHMDRLLEYLGEDGVALGSDFDGAPMPSVIKDVSGLPSLLEAFRRHGYGEELIEKIAWKNWMNVLERTIG